jgi:hypothetical protein
MTADAMRFTVWDDTRVVSLCSEASSNGILIARGCYNMCHVVH